jgi:acetylglutamate kinase
VSNHLKIVSGNILGANLLDKDKQSELDKFDIKHIIKNSREITGEFVVVKFPKAVIESEILLKNYCENISYLAHLGASIVIIPELSDVKADDMAYQHFQCYLSARKIIKSLNEFDVQAISLTASDSGMIRATRKKQNQVGDVQMFNADEIGKPKQIDPEILFNLQNANVATIILPIGLYGSCTREILLDVDLTAATISNGIDAKYLILPIENNSSFKLEEPEGEDLSSDDGSLACAVKLSLSSGAAKISIIDVMSKDAILKAIFKKSSK